MFVLLELGMSLSWLYGSWIYNYLCNQCLSPLKLWVRIPFMSRCTWYNIIWYSLSVTCDRSVVFSGYSGFLPQLNWPPLTNWNIVESGIKHHNPTNHLVTIQVTSHSKGKRKTELWLQQMQHIRGQPSFPFFFFFFTKFSFLADYY